MTILSILLTLKTILFINATGIEHNRVLIFVVTSIISLLVLSLIYLNNLKHKNKIGLIFYSLVSIVMLIDVMHYSHFFSLPSVEMLSQVGQLSDVSDSVLSLMTLKNLLFVLDIPLVIYYVLKRGKSKEERVYSNRVRIIAPIGMLIAVLVIFLNLNSKGQINSLRMQEIYSYHFNDIVNVFRKESLRTLDENTQFTEADLLELKHRTNLEEGKYTGIGKDRNLIVIQIEALQGFVMDLIYEGQEVTPNLNQLVHDRSSVYFDDYYQLLGRGNTSDAEFVSNNSLHPSMKSPTYTEFEDNTFYGLPWLLRDHGYNAWAFHAFKKEFWNREAAYPKQGFQRFLAEEDFEFEEKIGMGMTDKDFFQQTLEYMKELDNIDDNPFYAFIITLTSHNPFDMPDKYHVLDIKKEHEGTILGNYLQSIHYLDKCLGEFIEDLKAEGLYDNSVIALYGDHFAIQNSSEEIHELMEDFLGHKYDYDTIMRVPMAIHVPGEDLGETISTPGSQLDFFPTVLNIMGYKNEKGIMMGRDLVNYKGYNNVKAQAMMRKGSFVDKDVIFAVSRDEIFEHSTVTSRKTGKILDINEYRDIYDNTIEEINKSNFILENNLIKHMIANNGELDFSKIEIAGIQKGTEIKKSLSTINDLTLNYSKGYKTQTIEVEYTEDEKVILKNNSEDTIEDLISWLKLNTDVNLVIRAEENHIEIYEQLKIDLKDYRNRFIAEITDTDQHFFTTIDGFNNLILNISEQDYTDKEIIDFLKVHHHLGVLMEEEQTKTDLPAKIKELGIDTYTEDEEKIILYTE